MTLNPLDPDFSMEEEHDLQNFLLFCQTINYA